MCEARQTAQGKAQNRSEDYEYFVSVLAEVLPSSEEKEETSDESSVEDNVPPPPPVMRRRERHSLCSSTPRRCPPSATSMMRKRERHSLCSSLPKHHRGGSGVPLEVVVAVSDNDDSSHHSLDAFEDRCIQDANASFMSRDELNLLEVAEDPLPDFQSTVDALCQLSVSESTCSLPRSRAGGASHHQVPATTTTASPRSPRRSCSTVSSLRRSDQAMMMQHQLGPSRSMELVPPASMLVREKRTIQMPTSDAASNASSSSAMMDQSPRRPRRSLCICPS